MRAQTVRSLLFRVLGVIQVSGWSQGPPGGELTTSFLGLLVARGGAGRSRGVSSCGPAEVCPTRAANGRLRAAIGALLAAASVVAAVAAPSHATHYRYGRLTWTVAGGNTIEFTLENSWRRSAYTTGNNRCRNITLPGLPSTACTGGDGFPGVGDVIMESQGTPSPGTRFNFGDGSPLLGSPLGPLLYLVTAIDPANDWLIGTALDPASFPATDTNLTHTYAMAGNFTAFVATCCRVAASGGHINNADGNYR